MRTSIRIVSGLSLVLAVTLGCDKTTSEGPGGRKLTILRPANQTLERGKTNDISITVSRTNISAPLTVKFDLLPKGVSAVNADKKITNDLSIVDFTLIAARDASLVENHMAKVTVMGPEGMAASETFLITVKEGSAGTE